MNPSLMVLSAALENVTIGEILVCVTVISAIIAGVSKVKGAFDSFKKTINGWVNESLKPQFNEINKRLDELEKRNDRQDMENVKNYLVLFMADIERNGNEADEVELLRFEEQYEYYTKKGGNSYIHKKYKKLKDEGKI